MSRTPKQAPFPARLWTLDETAEFLSIPRGTLYQMNHKGTGPRFFRVGRHCRYDPRDVLDWLRRRASGPLQA